MVDLVKIRKKAKEKPPAPKGDAPPPPVEPKEVPTAQPAAESKGPQKKAKQEQPEPKTARSKPAQPEPAEPKKPQPIEEPPPTTSKLEHFKQQAGKRRQVEASKVAEVHESEIELLNFVIAGESYAVDIERIVEIVRPRPVTRIPNADSSIVGIVSLRGTVVTLVDVRRKLRHGAAEAPSPDTRIIVIDQHNEMVGFIVDRVLRVVKVAEREIEPHPVVHAAEIDQSIRGVFRAGDALTILLDLDKLLDHRALAATTA